MAKKGIFRCGLALTERLFHKSLSTELSAAQFNFLHQWYSTAGAEEICRIAKEPNLISSDTFNKFGTKLVSGMPTGCLRFLSQCTWHPV